MSSNPLFSYTRRDYEGSRQEGIAKIPLISKGNWTDLNATDPGIIILDYLHALVDMLNYYMDHQALETFISTAKERANIFRLAKQFSYTIRSAKGALCDVKFTSYLLYDHIIKIPRYTSVSTESGITYLTTKDAYLPISSPQITIPCVQGILYENKYIGTGISRFSYSTAENQSIPLNIENIDIDSISITDNIGRIWNRVDYIVFSTAEELAYQVELLPDNTILIRFGDGERGVVPSITDTFTIKYIVTAAEEGNVQAGAINILDTPVIDEGEEIRFSVTNIQASSGGSSVQSSSEIRALAPGAIKAQNRAVTLSDFENLAKLVEGVAAAKAYDINTHPDLCLHHEVKVLVIPDSSYTSPSALLEKVYDYLYQHMIPPTNLQVISSIPHIIDIDMSVRLVDTNYASLTEYNIRKTITAYFDELSTSIGEEFYPMDLSARISRLSNIQYVISMTPATTVPMNEFSVAKLGSVNISIQ